MREVGTLGISVGTSLAFESQQLDRTKGSINSYLINLRTLVRNARAASDEIESNDVERMVLAVRGDIERIASFLADIYKQKAIEFILYSPTYKGLAKKFPFANLKKPSTEKQKATTMVEEKILTKLTDIFKSTIVVTDCTLPAFSGNGIILTHHAVDLVLTNSITRLFLLESYTGNIKPYTKWYTKLTGKEEQLFNLPLNKLTIQVFGDNSVNFLSMSKDKKELVKSIALKGRWSSATTESRVRSTISTFANGVDREALLQLLNS